ncbi:MAG: hypothetical protein P1V97_27675 [Planctomycetota bacterium]|nr:hypothetical protein [Planctomycetota bacterium]
MIHRSSLFSLLLIIPITALCSCNQASSGSSGGAPSTVSPSSSATQPGSNPAPTIPTPPNPTTPAVQVCTPQSNNWQSDSLGYTLIESFQNAPYPHSSRSFTDDRVMVFIPKNFRITNKLNVLLHFHGHGGEINETDAKHKYRQQLVLAARNAVLVIPQGPLRASDSGIGKLEDSNGLKRLLDEVLVKLKNEGVIGSAGNIENLAISGHSGGYFAISRCLSRGGMDSVIREVYLHDALYGQSSIFENWAKQAGHKFVSTYQGAGSTRTNNLALASALRNAGVNVATSLSTRNLQSSQSIIVPLDHSHGNIVRARFLFSEMLQHSVLSGLGAPTPEIYSVQENSGLVTVSWSSINSSEARGLRIYRSAAGQSFQLIVDENTLSPQSIEYTFSNLTAATYFVVAAVDENGQEGPRSNVYGFAPGPRRVLVVDGFHRSQGSSLQGRIHSLAAIHGQAIAQSGFGFESCSANAVTDGDVLLSRYDTVNWFAGDQSDLDQSLTNDEQDALRTFLEGGGALLISGSELAYDLSKGNSLDRAFLRDTLHASYSGDNSGSPNINGLAGLSQVSLGIGGTTAAYPEDFPDYISPSGGSTPLLRYSNQRNAGIAYTGSFGGSSQSSVIHYLSFPFETVDTDSQRQTLMTHILAEFEAVHSQAGR